jgi:PAS domain S-box-containing protein
MADGFQVEALGAALLAELPEALLVVRPNGDVAYANAAAAQLLGYEDGELLGATVAQLVPPQSGQRVDPVKWFARWAEEPDAAQLRYLHLTGQTRSGQSLRLSVRVAKLTEPDLAYVVTLRDVTDEQQQHTEAKHAYLLASRILAISDDAIVNLDQHQRIIFFNRKAELLFGYNTSEVLGESLDVLLPERFRARHHEHVDEFRQGKDPSRLMGDRGEIVGRSKSGDEFPLEAAITKVFIDGVPTFSAHLRDIRERKAAERALAESEQRFRTIFEHALEAIALLGPDGRVVAVNDATAQLLPPGADPVGELFWELAWWPQEDEAARTEAQAAMAESVQRCVAGEEHRTRAELTDAAGRVHDIDFSLRPVRSEGATVAIVAEGRDLTKLESTG